MLASTLSDPFGFHSNYELSMPFKYLNTQYISFCLLQEPLILGFTGNIPWLTYQAWPSWPGKVILYLMSGSFPIPIVFENSHLH
jgi:hypothetical protein